MSVYVVTSRSDGFVFGVFDTNQAALTLAFERRAIGDKVTVYEVEVTTEAATTGDVSHAIRERSERIA